MKTTVGALLLLSASLASADSHEAVQRIQEASTVFTEIMQIDDKAIPQDLLDKAKCIAIVPGLKKGGFIVGATYGKGVMTCRAGARNAWSGPSTVRIEGGSIGAQIGGAESDMVLVVLNRAGAEKLMKSEFTLGGDITVAAGPVGRSSTAQTDALMNAQILSYSRARGVFAGIALRGGTLRSDDDDNEKIYGRRVSHEDILMGKVKAPASAKPLYTSLNRYFRAGGAAMGNDMPRRRTETSRP